MPKIFTAMTWEGFKDGLNYTMEMYARCRNMAKGGMKEEIHYGEHWGR